MLSFLLLACSADAPPPPPLDGASDEEDLPGAYVHTEEEPEPLLTLEEIGEGIENALDEMLALLEHHDRVERLDGRLYGLPRDDFDDQKNLTIAERLFLRGWAAERGLDWPESGQVQYPREIRPIAPKACLRARHSRARSASSAACWSSLAPAHALRTASTSSCTASACMPSSSTRRRSASVTRGRP